MVLVQDFGKCNVSRGTSYTILFLDCYPKCLNLLQMKHSDTPRSSDAPTNLIDNWGTHLSDRMFHISVMAGLVVKMLFSVYNTVYWFENQ